MAGGEASAVGLRWPWSPAPIAAGLAAPSSACASLSAGPFPRKPNGSHGERNPPHGWPPASPRRAEPPPQPTEPSTQQAGASRPAGGIIRAGRGRVRSHPVQTCWKRGRR